MKYKIAAAAAALLLIGGVIYIYFAHYAPFKPDEEQTLTVWYVNDDAMWNGFAEVCDEYNATKGKEYGIKLQLRAFEDQEEMYERVCASADDDADKPNIIACDTDFAAYLDEEDLLDDMDRYFGSWETSKYDRDMVAAAKSSNGLSSVPIAAQTQVFAVNTALFADFAAVTSFEKLCSVADEYYKRNSVSFFTISDYSLFFRDCIAQLGEDFDGVSPHDTDSENCKYIYKQLAETAYDRGFTSSGGEAAKMLCSGQVAAAVISSADIMQYADRLSGDEFKFSAFPYMKDGKPAYTEKVTGMTIMSADKQAERSAVMFLRWFASEKVNSQFVGDSGYLAAIGSAAARSEHAIYSELMDAVSTMRKNGVRTEISANAEYSENSRNFDNVMNAIMDSLN